MQAAYPFLAGGGLARRGIYIGRDTYGQAFCCDPFELYDAGIITSPNIAILGQIGVRKSTLVKSMILRSYLFGRYSWVIDVKREYGPVATAMHGTTVALRPGGNLYVNPISPLAGAVQQETLLQAVAAAALGRDLDPQEATGLTAALDVVRDHQRHREPVLPDIAELLLRPTAEMAARLVTSPDQLAEDIRMVALGLVQLCDGELRGMFDQPTSASIDWGARMIVLDLADVASSRALAVLMTCATAAMDAQVANRHRRAQLAQQPTPKTHGFVEESWRTFEDEQLGRAAQARYKLARKYGESHTVVMHRLSDMQAAGAAGTRAVRLAEGLLAETEIRVVYRQAPDQIQYTQEQLALSNTEAELLADLPASVALWHVGRHRTIVQHRISTFERTLVGTDDRMHLRVD